MASELIDHLTSLHTHAVDARHGYEEALEQAGGKGLTGVFRDMIGLHARNADEIAADLGRMGEVPDERGSFMTTVHRTIMDIRSLFGGLDESILPGLIDGEERNAAAYDKALALSDIPGEVRTHLVQQKSSLVAAILRMKASKP